MSLDALAEMPAGLQGSRFFRVYYFPTYAVLLFLLILVWAGAPGERISFKAAWETAANLEIAEALLIIVVVVLLALVLHPFQSALVGVLEGGWAASLGSGLLRRRQLARMRTLTEAAAPPTGTPGDQAVQAAGQAATRLRRRFPTREHLVRPTALGNALAAMQDNAGRAYGLDAVVAWPRLYAVLGQSVRGVVDDRRDTMDSTARLAASTGIAAIATFALLSQATHWWWLLGFVPLTVSVIAYRAAVHAAVAYGEAVELAFDLHRFDLLDALHLAAPADRAAELKINQELCDLWRQGVPPTAGYVTGGGNR
ncbi:hypothetical protein KZ829_07345 [Actinoplanes hulinensis]|uniref:ABC transmembrane type-1 domain-containing protein n=1 Tax=Actinoplanes hulinensis TaxID=1144547 RepID=A0ABS7AXR5_9ACTN|nr:hypothetical protein [Actinoplanes hulinensis]MBW6433558.1 hypothetical protein [Actinoplanes hulinensis]